MKRRRQKLFGFNNVYKFYMKILIELFMRMKNRKFFFYFSWFFFFVYLFLLGLFLLILWLIVEF